MTYWAEPQIIAKEQLGPAKKALMYAKNLLANGEVPEAKVQLNLALEYLEQGFARLAKYNEKKEVSGHRALLGINIAKDIALTLATGGQNLSPGTGAAIDGFGTAVEETTLLTLAAATGDQDVGWHDVSDAGIKVAVDAGASFVGGELGQSFVKRYAQRFGWTEEAQKAIADGIADHVKSNFKELARYVEWNCRGRKGDFKPNLIAMYLAPGIRSISVPGMGTLGNAFADADMQKMIEKTISAEDRR